MKTLLRAWLTFVASLRIFSVVCGYLKPGVLKENVFGLAAASEVTPLATRTFGIWTLLSCTVTLMCAANLESGPLYRTTMASFLIALIYFALEVGVYHTVDLRAAVSPGIIASKSRSACTRKERWICMRAHPPGFLTRAPVIYTSHHPQHSPLACPHGGGLFVGRQGRNNAPKDQIK